MNIIERYALSCGLKIDKPFIVDKFFPLAIDGDYITIHPYTKDAKSYDYFNEVVQNLLPLLKEKGISIIQIGAKDDVPLEGCYYTAGQTSLGQVAYIINNALLHLGVDSFPTHIASSYSKKIVALYSNNFIQCVKPYWSNPEDIVLLEPERNGDKPSFALSESPKTINTINPEKIIEGVCRLLKLDFIKKYETIRFGAFYRNRIIESVPDSVIKIEGLDYLTIRMDFHFNEEVLKNQLSTCKCSIITDKPISLDLLEAFRPQIHELFYIISNDHNVSFVENLQKLGIKFHLYSYLEESEIQKLKEFYMDLGIIHKKEISKFEINPEKLYYKSNKFTMSGGKIYPSKQAWKQGKSINSFSESLTKLEVIDKDFFEESEHFYLLKLTE